MIKTDLSNITTNSNDEKEEQLLDGLSFYIADSATTIMSIKQSVYELVNIGITITSSNRKIDSMAAIVTGSRKNLDDLKRIDSMLKGYLNSQRTNNSQDYQIQSKDIPDLQQKLTQSLSPNQNLGQNQEIKFYLEENQRLTQENHKLKQKIEQLTSNVQSTLAQNKAQDMTASFKPQQWEKSGLKRSNSEIFQTGKNLKEISYRNRQCLELIRRLKRQIVNQESEEENEKYH